MSGCTGVIHLAAVSRVVTAERHPETCWSTNVVGLRTVTDAALRHPDPRPWLIFTSSREVYGQPERLPVDEEAPLRPLNTYGRSKLIGECVVDAARAEGLRTAILRLSNVYGSTHDHADRVIPAFVRAAVQAGELWVNGLDHTFDFTHVEDTVRGVACLAERLTRGLPAPPPINLSTGEPTTLGDLAAMTVALAGGKASIRSGPPRSFDVDRFYAKPSRAFEILDWSPHVSLREGLARLIADHRHALGSHHTEEARP